MQKQIAAIIFISFLMPQGCAHAKSQQASQSLRQLIVFYKAQSLSTTLPDLFAYRKCVDNSGGVTVNLMNCSGDEIINQDSTLNVIYQSLFDKMNAQKKTKLRSAQRNWIHDRDKVCDLVSDDEGGGSLSAVIYNDCIVVLTTKRKIELKHLLNEN